MLKQKIKTRMMASCKCEIILEHLEETAAIAGGVEEVVDGVEEEDQEAQDRQHGVRVHRIPGFKQRSLVPILSSHKRGIQQISYA